MRAKTKTIPVQATSNLNNIHWLLIAQTIIIIFASINRLGRFTLGYVAENEFLRWVDLLNMVVFPLASLVAFYLLKKEIEYDSPRKDGRRHLALNLAFIIGIYLLAASYGDHEVTNYLNFRFCLDEPINSDLCRIIVFNDDEFSHWLFFAGFVLVNAALPLLQILFPYLGTLTTKDIVLLVANAVFIGAGIFANLGFEEIGFDLYVVALLTGLSLYLLREHRRQPLVIYYATAYTLGLIATIIVKAVGVGQPG
jgi:hypothetical protein